MDETQQLIEAIAQYRELAEWVRKDDMAARLVREIEQRKNTCTGELLLLPDVTTAEARELHFEAAACGRLFVIMNTIIENGKAAERALGEEREH